MKVFDLTEEESTDENGTKAVAIITPMGRVELKWDLETQKLLVACSGLQSHYARVITWNGKSELGETGFANLHFRKHEGD